MKTTRSQIADAKGKTVLTGVKSTVVIFVHLVVQGVNCFPLPISQSQSTGGAGGSCPLCGLAGFPGRLDPLRLEGLSKNRITAITIQAIKIIVILMPLSPEGPGNS
jgi:hypothetical protein